MNTVIPHFYSVSPTSVDAQGCLQRRVQWDILAAEPDVAALIELAIREDVGSGDVTTQAIFKSAQRIQGVIAARRPTVACGAGLAAALLRRCDPTCEVTALAADGTYLAAGEVVLACRADVRALLLVERCMLNFTMRLCGIAAGAWAAVMAVPAECRATTKIYDTRKTMPGWRLLDKAAVWVGGAENHRMGLSDGILIKDNHVQAAGSVSAALAAVTVWKQRHQSTHLQVELEVDTLAQLDEALNSATRPDIIMLDNFSDAQMREAVQRTRGLVLLEASGGVTLERIPAIARCGVDRISLGALTHSVMPADLGLDFVG